MTEPKPLAGLRLLVIEDEYLVAIELAHALERLGAEVVDTVGTLAQAERAMVQPLDGVVLDVRLGAERTFSLAGDLLAGGIPFIFATGYDAAIMPEHLRACPRLGKPIPPGELRRLAVEVFTGRERIAPQA